jgi:hypothetical protein
VGNEIVRKNMPFVVKIKSASFPGKYCYLMKDDYYRKWKWARVVNKTLAHRFESRIEALRAIQEASSEVVKNASPYEAPEQRDCIMDRLKAATVEAV